MVEGAVQRQGKARTRELKRKEAALRELREEGRSAVMGEGTIEEVGGGRKEQRKNQATSSYLCPASRQHSLT